MLANFVPLLIQNLEMMPPPVCNNASWAIGELVMHAEPTQLQPFIEPIMSRLISLVNDGSEHCSSLVGVCTHVQRQSADVCVCVLKGTNASFVVCDTPLSFCVFSVKVRKRNHHNRPSGLHVPGAHRAAFRAILPRVVPSNAPDSGYVRTREHVAGTVLNVDS